MPIDICLIYGQRQEAPGLETELLALFGRYFEPVRLHWNIGYEQRKSILSGS